MSPVIVAEQSFELDSGGMMSARLFAPSPKDNGNWGCGQEIDPPVDRRWITCGATPMQALVLGLSRLSIELYWNEGYESGRFGWDGSFRGHLGIPVTWQFLDYAPYPFRSGDFQSELVEGDAAADAPLLVEETYRLKGRRNKVKARIFQPSLTPDGRTWACRVSVDASLALERRALGASSLQALFAGLAVLSDHLYGSDEYRSGRLCWGRGRDAGNLILPATVEMLDHAPYPF